MLFGLPFGTLIGAGIGFVVGAFTPAVGRKIKSFFVTETNAVRSAAQKDVTSISSKINKSL